MCWWLVGRLGVSRLRDRFWLALLFGFSTQILWITTRGGVWHTGQLIATLLTFGCLLELWGKRRAWLIGLLAGAAFLTRAPLAFAVPFYALLLVPALADRPIDSIRGYLDRGAAGSRGARGASWRSGSCRRSSSSSPTTRSASGHPGNPVTRWRHCRRSSSSSGRSGCSRSPTSR